MAKLGLQLTEFEKTHIHTALFQTKDYVEVIGTISDHNDRYSSTPVIGIKNFKPEDIPEFGFIAIDGPYSTWNHAFQMDMYYYDGIAILSESSGEESQISEAPDDNELLLKLLSLTNIDNPRIIILSRPDRYEMANTLIKCIGSYRTLTQHYPIYQNIMIGESKKENILSLLRFYDKPEREKFYTALRYTASPASLAVIADRILEGVKIEGVDLMTQEEQVEAFLRFSRINNDDKKELVSDEDIERLEAGVPYQTAISKLTENGFGLSETQQFNVLQQVGLFANTNENTVYNLSDMGAGKTLMTVQSIFTLDMIAAEDFVNKDLQENETLRSIISRTNVVRTPDKHIIAPLLSIKSSWINTFKLFYDVEEISEFEYKLSFEHRGIRFESEIHTAPFTARSNSITVHNKQLTIGTQHARNYLIIDEVHQLVQRKTASSRFFDGLVPANDYNTFVLSGTLSNLTTKEVWRLVKFLGVDFSDKYLNDDYSREANEAAKREYTLLKNAVSTAAQDIIEDQQRTFDEYHIVDQKVADEKRQPGRELYLDLVYSGKMVTLTDTNTSVQQALLDGNFAIRADENILSTPNFELFYDTFGHVAVTAQSIQIAEELFGEQKTQHNADVIIAKSPLDNTDVELLKTLHTIATNHGIYKSQYIANSINNAILNLNDGLSEKSIYDVINHHAQNNTAFLQYLTTISMNILEALPKSNLIAQPKLEDTDKFKILKDIIENEPDETYLIVVNDYKAMAKLSKALDVEHLTKKQTTDAINYQESLDNLFEKQNIVVVPQAMIKSSLDLVQANRLIQYQLNNDISDIIQTQNRINRIGQTRETKAFYIATDSLQENLINLFLETYRNIRVAHKGIVELFVDMNSQINVVNDYISKALSTIEEDDIVLEDENGQTLLFDTTPYEVEVAQNDDEDVADEPVVENPNQMSLLTPDEIAEYHNLTFVGVPA